MNHYIIGSIIVCVVAMIIFGVCLPNEGEIIGNLRRTMARIFGCVSFFALAILVYAFLYKFIGISHTISAILTVIAYALFAFVLAYDED